MKSISVSEFSSQCLQLVDEVALAREPIVLTKDGKQTVMIVPIAATPQKKLKLGQFRHTATIIGDIVSPTDVPWDALV